MKKRRAEIVALALLVLFAVAERPSLTRPSIDFGPTLYQVGDLAPQRVETVRDLGVIAIKLVVAWID
jgi:hypothetical protein